MYLRLRLLLPLVPVLLENPQEGLVVQMVQTLVCLLSARIVHDSCTEDNLFELMLDLVSWISDEVPKDLKNQLLNSLRVRRFCISCSAGHLTAAQKYFRNYSHSFVSQTTT